MLTGAVSKYGVQTDLAVEARSRSSTEKSLPRSRGWKWRRSRRKSRSSPGINITTEDGARIMEKMPGPYSTLEVLGMRSAIASVQGEDQSGLGRANWRSSLFPTLSLRHPLEVVGLGNWNAATPDALGPKVVGNLMVTRHLYEMTPPEVRGGLRPVAPPSPGVLGLTGIETGR